MLRPTFFLFSLLPNLFQALFLRFISFALHITTLHYTRLLLSSLAFPKQTQAHMPISTEYQPAILSKYMLNEPARM